MKAVIEFFSGEVKEVVGKDLVIEVDPVVSELKVIDIADNKKCIFWARASEVICGIIWNADDDIYMEVKNENT